MEAYKNRPFSATIWDERETWSRDRIDAFQLDALSRQLQRVEKQSNHYRRVFAAAGFQVGDFKSFADLRRLPITRKEDYVAGLDVEPPFGSFTAISPREAVRAHFSSGTTARPTPVLWTQSDIERWADLYARYFYAQGLRKGDVVQCMFNYAWFVGGLGVTLAAQRIGALLIPASAGDTERQIETIFQYKSKCITGTPSFIAHLAEVGVKIGRDVSSSTVEMICLGGEPGASVVGTRERLRRQWDARIFDCYGALECQPIAWETAAQDGPVLADDFIYAEILNPETHEPMPDGERGVLVLTHLDKEACPLVRWWTGDVVVRSTLPSGDGRTHARLVGGVVGRADDMLIIRGVNLFPSAVEDIIRGFAGLTNEYVLVLDDSVKDPKTGFLNAVKLRVEREGNASADIGEHLSQRLREKLKVRFQVEVVESGTLPRTVHKAKRIIHA